MNIVLLNSSKKYMSVFFNSFGNFRIIQGSSHSNKKNGTKSRKPAPVSLSYTSFESTHSSVGSELPPVIIMHGLFGSKGNWKTIGKAIHYKTSPIRKIIAVDARNHGDSPHAPQHSYRDLALDVKEFLKSQHIKKTSLLGHSMGGRAMMMFALKNPLLVEKLIVVDISPIPSSNSDNEQSLKILQVMNSLYIDKNVSYATALRQADSHLSRVVNNKIVRAFLLTNLVKNVDGGYFWRINIKTLAANSQKVFSFPKIQNLKFEGPTLFIAGGLSDFIQKEDYAEIKRIFPKSKFKIIEGAGHWVHSEKPTEFVQTVTEFLNN